MADTDREVTKEEIEALAAKLAPAVESLSDGEREILELILERAGVAGAEVSGFAFAWHEKIRDTGGAGAVAWTDPLAGQLAGAAGMAFPQKFSEKWK